MVANGEKIRSLGMCKEVTINLQNTQFLVDFYLIELKGCDVVLGAQWLRTLGPIRGIFEVWKWGLRLGRRRLGW